MDALAKSSLFDGIALRAIPGLVSGLGAVTKSYDKGEMILWEGDRTDRVGILLSGRARSTKTDPHGRQVIVTLCFVHNPNALVTFVRKVCCTRCQSSYLLQGASLRYIPQKSSRTVLRNSI